MTVKFAAIYRRFIIFPCEGVIGLKWYKGYVTCRAADGSYERFLNICRHHNIEMHHIRQDSALFFTMSASDYVRLVPLAYKTSVVPHIEKRSGFPFWVRHVMREWTFYSGFLLFLVSLEVMSSFVWQISFSGQKTFTKETLARDMETLNVHTGMRRKNLDCDAIEKSIRQFHPQISWVSAEEVGSLLKVSVKEGQNFEEKEEEKPCHLTARYGGVVQSVTVNRGTAAVKPGDTVKKGDILISGIVPVTDDSDEVAEKWPVAARGEVVIKAEQTFSEKIPLVYKRKVKTGRILTRWKIQAGDSRFSLKNPFKQLDNSSRYDIITGVCCDRKVYPLPVSLKIQKKSFVEYNWKDAEYSREELKQEGYRRYNRLLYQLSRDNLEVLERSAVLKQQDEKNWLLEGKVSFLCREADSKPVAEKETKVKKRGNEAENDESGDNS